MLHLHHDQCRVGLGLKAARGRWPALDERALDNHDYNVQIMFTYMITADAVAGCRSLTGLCSVANALP